MQVLYYNNYDMREAWHNWHEHLGPDQHLYGTNYLAQDGIQVHILRHKFGKIRETSRYGNLNQQIRVTLKQFFYPVIYCGFFNDSFFLTRLARARFFRSALVSVLHHPLERNTETSRAIQAHWKISVLGKKIYAELLALWPEFKDKFVYSPWGADLQFYPKPNFEPKPDGYILSIGATRRDFKTLIEAAKKCDRKFVIITPREIGVARNAVPSNVILHEKTFLSYAETFEFYRDSLAVAVPLDLPGDYRGTQIGLSSLLEAMAMGRPTIITQHPLLDIDVQAEDIGLWTQAQNVGSWIDAINKISRDPEKAMEMGRRGRLLCEQKYNTARYGEDLSRLVRTHPAFVAKASVT
jgi:glycosyltransferase involved in cell wall biosynthesis